MSEYTDNAIAFKFGCRNIHSDIKNEKLYWKFGNAVRKFKIVRVQETV